ncbi:MAG: hypothetical protein V1857_02995 [archaeon]
MQLRAKMGLAEARDSLKEAEEKIWRYFPPRKLCDYFYATNHEGQKREIDRVFYDIDRPKDIPHDQAREVAKLFADAILNNSEISEFVKGDPLVAWAGSSFHVYLFLKKTQKYRFYKEAIQYSEKTPGDGFTSRWIKCVREKTRVKVIGGHEKQPGSITIDPSQTPSGKLARSVLGSLHMSDYTTVDGISVPIGIDDLADQHLTEKLRRYTPRQIVMELPRLSRVIEQP